MTAEILAGSANWVGPRMLLRRLRDVMAGPGDAQDRLNRIAKLIANDLVADVCSIYVRRAGDVLELFATEGLKQEAVHNTRLRIGEGIVGAIAADSRPMALAEARQHPNFAYRPETGEERYSSMMGVPVLRGGRMLGVLAIQNKTPRNYSDEEVETLETVSMVVGEMIAGGELIEASEQRPADGIGLKPLRLEGTRLNGGLALGQAVLHRPQIPVGRTVAEDASEEKRRLDEALAAMHKRLDDMLADADAHGAGDHSSISGGGWQTQVMTAEILAGSANWVGPRMLLRRLRDVMAGPGDAQDRLNRIAKLIANDLVADVCSIYVRRAGDVLELFATEGLKQEAVHNTRLRIGEGIVGAIAADSRPMALAEARQHPNFAYRPETGEERYSSMMGVPVLRGGRMLGVLAIQNKTPRNYSDEEVETLETVSMVVGEMIAGGELIEASEQRPADGIGLKPLRLEGTRLNGGLALGLAVLHRPQIPVGRTVAEDASEEKRRLDEALTAMHKRLDDMLADADAHGAGDHIDILKTYRMFAEDKGWIRRIVENIDNGLTAEGAVVRAQDDTRTRMKKVEDAYLRERLLDLEDLAYRLLQHLAGTEAGNVDLPDETVLFARNMGPADLLDYDRTRLKALVLEEGSSTSHAAIVARALQIPVVGRVKSVLDRVEPMDPVLVDGDNALCYLRPGEDVLGQFKASMRLFEEKRAAYLAQRDLPSVTRDGVQIHLQMNAGLLIDMAHLHATGAEGIGLYRTEVPFMVRSEFPDVEAQASLYGKLIDAAEGKPITFRTLDIGGDKILPYFHETGEENPAMGWRAIRIAIDRPGLLRSQLRALIQASNGRPLRVMFPMVANADELSRARWMLEKELTRAGQRGCPLPETVQVGAMLEVPSLIFQIEALAGKLDFLSIGSNDLLQFLFAADRGNPRMDGRYDSLSAPVLCVIRDVLEKAARAGIAVSVCGEIAGSPLDALALIGLGVRNLSMTPASIGPVRDAVRGCDTRQLAGFVETLMHRPDRSLRVAMANFARDHGIPI